VEKFVTGKSYMLAFQIPDTPGEIWAEDPWDAEYLGISKKELSQAAHVVRARGLIELDPNLKFARPSDKLLATGWPDAVGTDSAGSVPQTFTLSNLPTKGDFITDLKKLLAQRGDFALVFADLDQFKQVNDTRGHAAGDQCLERVIQVISRALGRKGRLYRWRGDEFAVMLADFATEEAIATAERIRRAIEQAKAGGDIAVTASIGVCGTDMLREPTAEAILEAADSAMYTSKKNGKNRVSVWSGGPEGQGEREPNS
jgi:diguanylate cyclase (GGDEF)-like protein